MAMFLLFMFAFKRLYVMTNVVAAYACLMQAAIYS
jgi:hypothetical protein